MKEEIVQGLKNAIERGYSLESAAQSFVNAGYNPREVQEAMALLSSSTISRQVQPIQQQTPQQPTAQPAYTSPKKQLISPQSNTQPIQQQSQGQELQIPQIPTESQRKRKKILIILGIILLIILGGIVTLSLLAESILKSIA